MQPLGFPLGVLLACLVCVPIVRAAQDTRAERRLADGAGSPEELARRFLDALARNEIEDVRRLAMTEEEFRTRVYPELPVSDPARNASSEFVWNMLHIRSESNLHSVMRQSGGRTLALEDIRFRGESEAYDTFRVHRESMLVLTDDAGERQTASLFGSVLEMDGRFKIFSFNR